jgi:hypothetical protein
MTLRAAVQEVGCAVLLILCAIACGDDTSSTSGGMSYAGGPVPQADLPATLARSVCNGLKPCCEQAGFPFNASTCENTFSSALSETLAAADENNYSYDPAAAGACLRALEDAGGGVCTDQMQSSTADATCDSAFEGHVPPGGACHAGIECAGPADADIECRMDGKAQTGTCFVEARVGEGDPCFWTCTQTGNAYSCGGSGSLDDKSGERQRCFTNDGLHCSSDGVCTRLAPRGEACDGDQSCEAGLYCNFESSVCEDLLGEGDACVFSGCAEDLYCKNDVCVPKLSLGSPCMIFQDECAGGTCDNGTCVEAGSLDDLADVGLAFICAFGSGALGL